MSETPEHVENSMTVDDAGGDRPKIPAYVKAFIVQRLACYDTPQQVADAVIEEFGPELEQMGISIDRRYMQTLDPERTGIKPGKKWRDLFEQTRAAFLKNSTQIPIANKSTRLRALDRMAKRAEAMGNLALAKELHEQAAKEMGDVYTNRRLLDIDPEGSLAELLGIDPSKLPSADGSIEANGPTTDRGAAEQGATAD
jgi:hypothetical protein